VIENRRATDRNVTESGVFPEHTGSARLQAPVSRPQLLAAIVLLAFALRLAGLGHKSLWIDEADSVYFAQHAWDSLLWRLCDPHPPGYYALLKLFIELGGISEFAVRLPSAIAGVLTVAALARFTHEFTALAGPKKHIRRKLVSQALPAALLAVSPLHVWYSQEARMYAWVTLLGLGAAIFAVRLAQEWRWPSALGYLAMATAALLVDQSAAPVLVGLIGGVALLAGLQRKWGMLGRWLSMQSVPVLLFYAWYQRASYASQISAATLYPLTMLRMALDRWRHVVYAPHAILPWHLALAGLVVIGILATGTTALARRDKAGRHGTMSRVTPPTLTEALIRALLTTSPGSRSIAWLILVVYAAGTVVSVVPRLYTLKRLLVSLLPYALLFVAWAPTALPYRRLGQALILAASLALSILNIVAIPKAPWREAVTSLEAQIQPGDSVWVDELAVPAFDYYDRGKHAREVLFVNSLGSLAEQQVQGSLWLVADAGRYRNLLDFLPGLSEQEPTWRGVWPGIEARAYDPAQLDPAALLPDVPQWALGWPSPLDEACKQRN